MIIFAITGNSGDPVACQIWLFIYIILAIWIFAK